MDIRTVLRVASSGTRRMGSGRAPPNLRNGRFGKSGRRQIYLKAEQCQRGMPVKVTALHIHSVRNRSENLLSPERKSRFWPQGGYRFGTINHPHDTFRGAIPQVIPSSGRTEHSY